MKIKESTEVQLGQIGNDVEELSAKSLQQELFKNIIPEFTDNVFQGPNKANEVMTTLKELFGERNIPLLVSIEGVNEKEREFIEKKAYPFFPELDLTPKEVKVVVVKLLHAGFEFRQPIFSIDASQGDKDYISEELNNRVKDIVQKEEKDYNQMNSNLSKFDEELIKLMDKLGIFTIKDLIESIIIDRINENIRLAIESLDSE